MSPLSMRTPFGRNPRGTISSLKILNHLDVYEGMTWRIRTEIPLGDKMICSIYSEYNNGIAVFEKQENGRYKWQGCSYMQRGSDYPLWDSVITDGEVYNLFMLNRDEAATMKVVYTEHGSGEQKTYQFDVTETDLVYTPSVFNSCQVDYNYYDADGNALFD